MKVLALNGSPRMKASSTYHIMKPFTEGMEKAGAEVEIVHIRQLELNPCIGCFTCWARTPGVCIHKDAMTDMLAKYQAADLVIFGTPLYHFDMTGLMKTFIDRLLPRFEPWLIPHPQVAGVTGHPERWRGPKKSFLISPCGFPELEHFDSLVATMQRIARMEGMEYAGEILRTCAEPMSRESNQPMFSGYYDLVRQAGEQLVRDGQVAPDLHAALHRDLFPVSHEQFREMANGYWNQQMDRFKVPEEQRHVAPLLAEELDSAPMVPGGGRRPLPEPVAVAPAPPPEHAAPGSARALVFAMPAAFQPQVASRLGATIQFRFSGAEPGDYYLTIANNACTVAEGITTAPTLTIESPAEVWVAIARGELSGQAAFASGQYKVSGSMGLLLQLASLFPSHS